MQLTVKFTKSFAYFQDIALFTDFTIRDTMFYFGKIFGMSTAQVEERFAFLHRMLELPPEERLIINLRQENCIFKINQNSSN